MTEIANYAQIFNYLISLGLDMWQAWLCFAGTPETELFLFFFEAGNEMIMKPDPEVQVLLHQETTY